MIMMIMMIMMQIMIMMIPNIMMISTDNNSSLDIPLTDCFIKPKRQGCSTLLIRIQDSGLIQDQNYEFVSLTLPQNYEIVEQKDDIQQSCMFLMFQQSTIENLDITYNGSLHPINSHLVCFMFIRHYLKSQLESNSRLLYSRVFQFSIYNDW